MATKSLLARTAWALFLAWVPVGLCLAQELPTATPEDVGVSSGKVAKLSEFMQSLVDDGKIAGGVTMMARHGKVIHLKAVVLRDKTIIGHHRDNISSILHDLAVLPTKKRIEPFINKWFALSSPTLGQLSPHILPTDQPAR